MTEEWMNWMKRNEFGVTDEVKGMKKNCWRRTDEEEQIKKNG